MSNSTHDRRQTGEGSRVLLPLVGFGLVLILSFSLVANMLPQVEGEAPVDEEINLADMDMQSFTALGESIYTGKGSCALCHNDLGRAPNMLELNMTETANERLGDSRYQGRAANAEEYLRESMLEPSAYVVKGYGKKGSGDTVSPMPATNKAPASLTDVEIDAVIAFLQAKDGYEITVSLPSAEALDSKRELAAEAASALATAVAKSGEEAVAKYVCSACHSMTGSESPIGPDLDTVASRLSADEIRQSIVDPDAVIAEGFSPGLMPRDYPEKMTVSELDMIVQYLATKRQ